HNENGIFIGSIDGGINFFEGLIDEVVIYDRPLTADEIQAIFLADSGGMYKPIYINSSTTINSPGVYILTQNIISTVNPCIEINADDVILDGGCYKLFGPGTGSGIHLDGHSNVTITNFHIQDFAAGIDIQNGNDNYVKINYLKQNVVALNLSATAGTSITNNVMTENQIGLAADLLSTNNNIYYNLIINNDTQMQDLGSNFWFDAVNNLGNFWSNYWGEDTDGDGVGNTDLPHQGVDHAPLVDPSIPYQFDLLPFGGDWWGHLTWVLVWRGGWSPVEIQATDPLGQVISSGVNEIGNDAFYVEDEQWEPGSKKVMIIIAISPTETGNWGEYSFQMTAQADLTYSMEWFASTMGEKSFHNSVEEVPMAAGETQQVDIIVEEYVDPETGEIIAVTYPENSPPVPDAGDNIQISSADQYYTVLSGMAADPDEDPLQYRWLEGEVVLLDWTAVGAIGDAYLDLSTLPYFSLGIHTLTLEVSDGQLIGSDGMILTIDNSPPTAQPAPTSQKVQIGIDPIVLVADVSDFDGDMLLYEWLKGTEVLESGNVLTIPGGAFVPIPDLSLPAGDPRFPLGDHEIVLQVSDGVNVEVSGVLVIVQDTTSPSLIPIPSVTILWPPNHTLQPVIIQANAFDNGGGAIHLDVTVASSEPPDSDGDGNTIPDYYIDFVDDASGLIDLRLRSERKGKGDGRTYTITITATDASQNSSVAEVKILAPHDRRKK
ncbi:NosD domain-containing protein, partial [Planctomycetota bacterium]